MTEGLPATTASRFHKELHFFFSLLKRKKEAKKETVPGVKEDVTNIILNLKQVRFKQVVEEFENEKVSITVENSTD